METGTLKHLRTVAPGIIILLYAIPIYTYLTQKPMSILEGFGFVTAGIGIVISYIIGSLYNLYCLRAVFNRRSHRRITNNIKRRLLEIGRTIPLPEDRRQQLIQGRELMEVFYSIIDSDDSLKERAKLVRNNGLIWSTIADFTVIGATFCILYILLGYLTSYVSFYHWSIGMGVLAVICGLVLHPRAEKRQIELGEEQLHFIKVNHLYPLREKIDNL